MPCFLAGVSAATAFSLSRALPLIELTHQQGHIAAAHVRGRGISRCLSGSHLYFMSPAAPPTFFCAMGPSASRRWAQAAICTPGQAVDRLGVKLGFPFPAGVYVSEQAALCKEKVHPKVSVHGLTCSLSGLENQCAKLLADGHDAALCLQILSALRGRNACADGKQRPGRASRVYLWFLRAGVMSSDLIRTYVTNRVPNAHFVPGKFASDNAIGISILAARECGAWPTTSM